MQNVSFKNTEWGCDEPLRKCVP